MLKIWRRHTAACPHRARGRDVLKCNCPLWADGYVDGKRVLRQSFNTRDLARARKKAVALESSVFNLIFDAPLLRRSKGGHQPFSSSSRACSTK